MRPQYETAKLRDSFADSAASVKQKSTKMPRVSFYTLGCKLNFAETSTLGRDFEARGFDVVPFGEGADVTVINTCSVTDEADKKCRNVIRRALRRNPDAFIAVTGCYAQLKPEEIAAIDGVDIVLGTREKFRMLDIIGSFDHRERTQVEVSCIAEATDFGPSFSSGERMRTFLKVQDGCDYTCSFCTIPLARGRSRSNSVEAAVTQARQVAGEGVREIVLTGVNIGLFGEDTGSSLVELLRELDTVEGIDRYRISSIEPNLLTDEIIDFVAQSQRFMPHFHMPLQSGDDYVLGKMRRRYRSDLYARRVEHILRVMPDACIGVDVIVGFPAETDACFENSYGFIESLPVGYLHVFTYSERADTAAVDQPDRMGGTPVPPNVRSHRNRRLRLLSEKKRHAFYDRHRGETRTVLWEYAGSEPVMTGFTENYIKLSRPADHAFEGRIEAVTLGGFAADGTLEALDPMLALA
jgi:threonylcarbamoyladenosine tRNA methylthiotransferase MtaB